jgi:hypothetical protein
MNPYWRCLTIAVSALGHTVAQGDELRAAVSFRVHKDISVHESWSVDRRREYRSRPYVLWVRFPQTMDCLTPIFRAGYRADWRFFAERRNGRLVPLARCKTMPTRCFIAARGLLGFPPGYEFDPEAACDPGLEAPAADAN